MSSHYTFTVHVSTPGETDDEDDQVRELAQRLNALARTLTTNTHLTVTVSEVQRT